MLKEELKQYLFGVDNSSDSFDEHIISNKIREIIKADDTKSLEDEAEIFAFNVYTDTSNSTSWNSYFGPMMSFSDKNGEAVDFPTRNILNEQILTYWRNRFNESKHPFFKARYADLIIEFANYNSEKIEPEIFNQSIDSHIDLSKQDNIEDIEARQQLERAFYLIKKYNKKDKYLEIFGISLELEEKIAQDDKPGLWGFVLEWFLLDPNFSVPEDKEIAYINNFNDRRKRLISTNSIGSLENATVELAKYYRFKKDYSQVEKILKEYEDCIRNFKEYKESSFGKLHYLQNLEETYMHFNNSNILTGRLNMIRDELRNFRLDPNDPNFKSISVTQDISKEDIDKFLEKVYESKEFSKIILRIIVNFFLRKEKETQKFDELNKKYIFAKIASGDIFDDENRFIATLPPLDEAPELHFIKHCSNSLQINSVFLSLVFKKMKEDYTKDDLAELIKNSGLNNESENIVIDELLDSFWNNKYLAFIHIAVPFIESSLRRLFLTSGMVVSIENKIGGYDYKPINKLLEHEQANIIFKHIFKDAGENLLYTIRIIFTEKIGLNLRNKVAHGIYQSDFSNEKHSNYIMLILLILSLIRINK